MIPDNCEVGLQMPDTQKDSPVAEVRAAMLAAGGAPIAKTVPSSQTVEVAGKVHTLEDEYDWLHGKAWPKLVQGT